MDENFNKMEGTSRYFKEGRQSKTAIFRQIVVLWFGVWRKIERLILESRRAGRKSLQWVIHKMTRTRARVVVKEVESLGRRRGRRNAKTCD